MYTLEQRERGFTVRRKHATLDAAKRDVPRRSMASWRRESDGSLRLFYRRKGLGPVATDVYIVTHPKDGK